MGRFFQLGREKRKLWVAKFEKYFSKDLTLDLLNATDNIVAFYSKEAGWIGANRVFFEIFKFEDIYEFLKYHKSIRELFFTEKRKLYEDDDTRWLEYIKDQDNGSFKVTVRLSEGISSYTIKVTHSLSFRDLYIVELSDVTELDVAIKKIKEIEYLKSTFLSRIGHELRTPMNGVLGFAELLSQTELDKLQKSYLAMLKRSSEFLVFNIESLLSFSMLQSGELKINATYFDISKHLQRLANHFSIIVYEGRSKLYTFIDPQLPKEIYGDIKKIEHILKALLQHSIEYTEKGEWIFFDVKLLKQRSDGSCDIEFIVRHNGRGLSTEEIKTISKPFSSIKSKSLDMGLAIASEYLKMLGSKLQIESNGKKGSHFSFKLYAQYRGKKEYKELKKVKINLLLLDYTKQNAFNILTSYFLSFDIKHKRFKSIEKGLFKGIDFVYVAASKANLEQLKELALFKGETKLILIQSLGEHIDPKTASFFDATLKEPFLPSLIYNQIVELKTKRVEKISQQDRKSKKDIKVLVAEDNVINQKLIGIILKNKGFNVDIASDGQIGVEMAKKWHYDIIFMDIDMPRKDGVTAMKEIKKYSKINASTPIIAFTAKALEGDREQLLKQGFDGYMSKPIQKEELDGILLLHQQNI